MQATEVEQALCASTAEVLETMFFTEMLSGVGPSEMAGPLTAARLAFHGDRSGSFMVIFPVKTARSLAAGFLGLDEDAIPDVQVGEVVCEFANMVCGSVLSRLEGDTVFDLSHPELETPVDGCRPEPHVICRTFDLGIGSLACCLDIGRTG